VSLVLLFTAALGADPVLPPGSIPTAVLEAMAAPAPIAGRLEAVTTPLLGVPYLLDPLGEGQAPDLDPLARYDAFDCQTFVEEALALALAADPADAGRIRVSLRYGDGPIDYDHRRHFMELQWIPGNLAAGWIRQTTGDYGAVRTLSVSANDQVWATWSGRAKLKLSDEALPRGSATLDVLPLAAAITAAAGIRPGSVVMIAHEERAGVPLLITHLGLVMPGGRFRHASSTSKVVRDQDLADYLRRAAAWKGWPVAGVAIYEPVEPTSAWTAPR
jgi:cell wall-associated NlpC family hydrolase